MNLRRFVGILFLFFPAWALADELNVDSLSIGMSVSQARAIVSPLFSCRPGLKIGPEFKICGRTDYNTYAGHPVRILRGFRDDKLAALVYGAIDSKYFEEIAAQLRRKFGKPKVAGAGDSVANVWESSSSVLVLKRNCGTVSTSCLVLSERVAGTSLDSEVGTALRLGEILAAK